MEGVFGLPPLWDTVNLSCTLANRVPADDDPTGSTLEAGNFLRLDQPLKDKRFDHILTTIAENNRNQHGENPLCKNLYSISLQSEYAYY